MIARSEREAIRQGAIAERRKALFEKYAQPKVRKAIIAVGNLGGDMYEEGGEARIENLLESDAVEILRPVLFDIYRRVTLALRDESRSTLKCWKPTLELKTTPEDLDVVTDTMLNLFETFAMEHSTVIAKMITEKTIDNLRTAIAKDPELIQQGPRAVARMLRKRATDLSAFQSERIARTEVLMSYSQAQDGYTRELWDEAEDGPLYKKWSSSRDRRTRDDHKKMNGKIVRYDAKFILPNGDELKYPGDSGALKVESFVNCRCSYSSIPEELVPKRYRMGE